MPVAGVEPARGRPQRILSPAVVRAHKGMLRHLREAQVPTKAFKPSLFRLCLLLFKQTAYGLEESSNLLFQDYFWENNRPIYRD